MFFHSRDIMLEMGKRNCFWSNIIWMLITFFCFLMERSLFFHQEITLEIDILYFIQEQSCYGCSFMAKFDHLTYRLEHCDLIRGQGQNWHWPLLLHVHDEIFAESQVVSVWVWEGWKSPDPGIHPKTSRYWTSNFIKHIGV